MFISLFAVLCVTVSQVQLMDFAQRMRVERITGSVSVYSSEPFSGNLAASPKYVSSKSLGDILTGLHDTTQLVASTYPFTILYVFDHTSITCDKRHTLLLCISCAVILRCVIPVVCVTNEREENIVEQHN